MVSSALPTETLQPSGPTFSTAQILLLQAKTMLGLLPPFDPLVFARDNAKYGPITRVVVGPIAYYQVNAPELIHEMIVTKADQFEKAPIVKTTLGQVIGNGLLTSDGAFWKRQRKLAQPAFHAKRIQGYAETMVALTKRAIADWKDGETRKIDADMMALTLAIVTRTLFGADLGTRNTRVARSMPTVLHVINEQINSVMKPPAWVPTPQRIALRSAIRELDLVLDEIIAERRQAQTDSGDLLSMLMMAVDDEGGGMSNRQLRDEAMTIFIAGHETTANALNWTFYLLDQHPDAAAKIHAEIDAVLNGRPPTLADLPKLTYCAQVIKESMRLYPPATGLTRSPIADVTLGGYPIPRGALITVSTYSLHRDPTFFADPDRFDPDRFNPANEAAIPKYAYLPFGGGPRVCIGNMFAEMESILALVTIAQKWRLSIAPGQKVQPEQQITLRPKYGLRMIAHARSNGN